MSFILAGRGIQLALGLGIGVALAIYEMYIYRKNRERTCPVKVYSPSKKEINSREYFDQPSISNEPFNGSEIDFTMAHLAEMVDDMINKGCEIQLEALKALRCSEEKFGEKASYHWRMARSLWSCSFIEKKARNKRKQMDLLNSALEHAQKTVKIIENDHMGQRWIALIFSEINCHDLSENSQNLLIAKSLLKSAQEKHPLDPYIARELFFIMWKEDYQNSTHQNEFYTEDNIMQLITTLPSKKTHLYLSLSGFTYDRSPENAKSLLLHGLSLQSVTPEDFSVHEEMVDLAMEKDVNLPDVANRLSSKNNPVKKRYLARVNDAVSSEFGNTNSAYVKLNFEWGYSRSYKY